MRENLVQLLKFSKKKIKVSKEIFLRCQPWTDTGNYATMLYRYMQMIWVWGLNVRTFLYTFWPKIEL